MIAKLWIGAAAADAPCRIIPLQLLILLSLLRSVTLSDTYPLVLFRSGLVGNFLYINRRGYADGTIIVCNTAEGA